VYQTLLIEPPVFLPRLDADLRQKGVQFVARAFADADDIVSNLAESIIVDCTGLGARTLWNDRAVRGIKGQLAMLPAQPQLQYLYGQDGYMFPRSDAVVIGGSYEDSFTSPDPDPEFCKLLVDYMKGLFGKGPRVPIPDAHIHHPSNLPLIVPQGTVGV